jgi:hypothetical protein
MECQANQVHKPREAGRLTLFGLVGLETAENVSRGTVSVNLADLTAKPWRYLTPLAW